MRSVGAVALCLIVTGCSLAGANGESDDGDTGGVGGGDGSGNGGGLINVTLGAPDSENASGVGSGGESGRGGAASDIPPYEDNGLDLPPLRHVCEGASPEYVTFAHATVDDSSSFASPMLVRELTQDPAWRVGDPLPVRAHEFLNFYGEKLTGGLFEEDLDDGLHVGVDADVDTTTDYNGKRLITLAVSLTSFDAANVEIPDVTFVMDSSESMTGEGVERLAAVVRGAATAMSTTPRSVAAFTTAGQGTPVREMLPWDETDQGDAIVAAGSQLSSDVDLDNTLRQAFTTARDQALRSSAPGVVMVISDGDEPLGADLDAQIAEERERVPPVRVVGVGVGPARSYADDLLERITDESGGAYFYAPSQEAAEAELAARFSQLTQIAARNVALNLSLPSTIELVAVAGGPGMDGNGLADGQNLSADTTMTFQVYLLADAETSCPTIGVSLSWEDPRFSGDTALRQFPGGDNKQEIALWERFYDEYPPSESMLRVEAIVAAADAMRGPTAARLERAVDLLGGFLKAVPNDRITELCGPLSTFCRAEDVDCRICTPQ